MHKGFCSYRPLCSIHDPSPWPRMRLSARLALNKHLRTAGCLERSRAPESITHRVKQAKEQEQWLCSHEAQLLIVVQTGIHPNTYPCVCLQRTNLLASPGAG